MDGAVGHGARLCLCLCWCWGLVAGRPIHKWGGEGPMMRQNQKQILGNRALVASREYWGSNSVAILDPRKAVIALPVVNDNGQSTAQRKGSKLILTRCVE